MARTVRDANLETRTARLRLPIRTEPYWRGLEKGFALGYRRRASGGTWLGRRRQADGGYVEHRIGTTDDLQDADGVAVLDYAQAQKAARELASGGAAGGRARYAAGSAYSGRRHG
jgi:hypothetical protein